MLHKQSEKIDMHVFCDASEKAYGACVYLLSTDKNGKKVANLLCAKSRVAPLQNQSVAKLELCAAFLGAQLIKKLKYRLNCKLNSINLWSDSMIALTWINSSPHKWKQFVANRTSEIQEICAGALWKYVPSQENPADILSRGSTPIELIDSKLWWSGPPWLIADQEKWPVQPQLLTNNQDLPEAKTICNLLTKSDFQYEIIETIVNKFSSLQKIKTTLA